MRRAALTDVTSELVGETSGRTRLSEPLETTDVAINHYRIGPEESLPGGLHAHADQEEVFVVLEGEATFETMDGDVTVEDGEAIRFAPGEFQSGRNDADGELVLLALGAPRSTEDVRIPMTCPDCGEGPMRLETDQAPIRFVCPECGTTRVPDDCPTCGHDVLEFTLGDDRTPVVACRECRRTFADPPLRD